MIGPGDRLGLEVRDLDGHPGQLGSIPRSQGEDQLIVNILDRHASGVGGIRRESHIMAADLLLAAQDDEDMPGFRRSLGGLDDDCDRTPDPL